MYKKTFIDLAFEYYKTKLWKKLYDIQLFGLEMTDGTEHYISIMGHEGQYNAIAVYSKEGVKSFIDLFEKDDSKKCSVFEYRENQYSHENLQVVFDSFDEIPVQEMEQLDSFYRQMKASSKISRVYPVPRKFEYGEIPWLTTNEQNLDYLKQALCACIQLANVVKGKRQTTIEKLLPDLDRSCKVDVNYIIPGFRQTKDGLIFVDNFGFPNLPQHSLVEGKKFSQIQAMKLKKFRKYGVVECDLFMYPEAVWVEEYAKPLHTHSLMSISLEKGTLNITDPQIKWKDHTDKIINNLLKQWCDHELYPQSILVRDERTYHLLEPIANYLKISISKTDRLTLIHVQNDLFNHFENKLYQDDDFDDLDEETKEMIEFLMFAESCTVSEFQKISPDHLNFLRMSIKADELDFETKDNLIKQFKKAGISLS